jgi:hypothetical protein
LTRFAHAFETFKPTQNYRLQTPVLSEGAQSESCGDAGSHSASLHLIQSAGQLIMKALTFWKVVAVDRADLLEQLIALLDAERVRYCVIGGQAVNAYVEPVVSLDLDLAVAVEDLVRLGSLLEGRFTVERFAHSLNVSLAGSDLRVQIQLDPRYHAFVDRASTREVLGVHLSVAHIEDVLQGKVWAAEDPTRRGSKRQKDLADIARLLESYPELRSRVPATVLQRLV